VKRVVGDHDQLFADQAMKGGEGGDDARYRGVPALVRKAGSPARYGYASRLDSDASGGVG
jgi:hypothetical protein